MDEARHGQLLGAHPAADGLGGLDEEHRAAGLGQRRSPRPVRSVPSRRRQRRTRALPLALALCESTRAYSGWPTSLRNQPFERVLAYAEAAATARPRTARRAAGCAGSSTGSSSRSTSPRSSSSASPSAAIMLWEVYRYFSHDWIARYFIDPTFHFTYPGFGWVQPLARRLDVRALRRARRPRGLHRARLLLPDRGAALLPRLLVRLPARAGALPEPLLLRDADQLPADLRPGAPGVLARRVHLAEDPLAARRRRGRSGCCARRSGSCSSTPASRS